MKLLNVLVNNKHEIILQKTSFGYTIPSNNIEVDLTYGFDINSDNLFFLENCGLYAYRRYIFFCLDYCVAVFEYYKGENISDSFIWIKYNEIQSYIYDKDELYILENVILNFNYSKSAPWVQENGFKPYFEWVISVAREKGFTITGEIIQIKNAYVSTLFKIPSSIGALYLKIPAKFYLNDITRVESFLIYDIYKLPEIIAIYPDNSAFLTRAMQGNDLNNVDNITVLSETIKQWAITQQKYTSNNKSFSNVIPYLHDFSASSILNNYENYKNKLFTVLKYKDMIISQSINITDELITKKLDSIKLLLEKLNKYNIPDTLCHGDLRPGNIRDINGAYILYDWGMSIFVHPFYDITHFLYVIRRQLSENDKEKLLRAYLEQWTNKETIEKLLEVYSIIEQLRNFFMVISDCEWLYEIIQKTDNNIRKYSIDDWLFSRRLYYFSRVFDRFMLE